jgi:CBS domain containing-hemolysin-like protein
MDIVILTAGIIVSATCEYLAAALLDLRQSVFTSMAEEGSRIGRRFRDAYESTDETALSISLVDMLSIVGASIGALTISEASSRDLAIELGIFVLILAAAKVIAGVIGTRYAEHLLRITSLILVAVRLVAYPALLIHRILMRVTHQQTDEEEAREELEAIVETAREEGALDAGEYRIMTNIMKLSSISVSDVMTPRTVVFGLSADTTVEDALRAPELQIFSRFPILSDNDLDHVEGYVIAKDVLRAALASRRDITLSKLKREVKFIPENITIERALEQFLQSRQHMFMVVDEHGGVEGIVTMEDVMETMLGVEIVDEADHVEDLRDLAKQKRDERIARLGEMIAQEKSD